MRALISKVINKVTLGLAAPDSKAPNNPDRECVAEISTADNTIDDTSVTGANVWARNGESESEAEELARKAVSEAAKPRRLHERIWHEQRSTPSRRHMPTGCNVLCYGKCSCSALT